MHNKLNDPKKHYNLYLSQRGNNSLKKFQTAVSKAIAANTFDENERISYQLEIVPSKEMPELSIVDYLLWACNAKSYKARTDILRPLKTSTKQ